MADEGSITGAEGAEREAGTATTVRRTRPPSRLSVIRFVSRCARAVSVHC